MSLKQDRATPRTVGDIERKYSLKYIKETKEKVESQERDLTFLIDTLDLLHTRINELNDQIQSVNEQYIEISKEVEVNTESRHEHENKDTLDTIDQKQIDNWNNKGTYQSLEVPVQGEESNVTQYKLILIRLENTNIYVPCFKYENTFKGNMAIMEEEQIKLLSVSMTIENNIVTELITTYPVEEMIGII